MAACLTVSHKFIQNSLKPSTLFQAQIKAATKAAIAAITNIIGFAINTPQRLDKAGITEPVINPPILVNAPVIKLPILPFNNPNAPFNIPIVFLISRKEVIILPIINNVGPTAAAINAIVTINCLTGPGNLFNACKNLVNIPITKDSGPVVSPRLSCNASQAEPNCFSEPLKVLFIISDIFCAEPLLFSRDFVNLSISSAPVLHKIPIAFIESAVNVLCNAAVFSASPIPSVAFVTSAIISDIFLKLPLASCTATLVFPICIFPSFILLDISLITAFKAVPASLPLRPWSASLPNIAVVSSNDIPALCALTAQFLNASPSCCVVVLE